MAKQSKPFEFICDDSRCHRRATIGVYRWVDGDSDVDLDHPEFVTCGQHKVQHDRDSFRRNVPIVTT